MGCIESNLRVTLYLQFRTLRHLVSLAQAWSEPWHVTRDVRLFKCSGIPLVQKLARGLRDFTPFEMSAWWHHTSATRSAVMERHEFMFFSLYMLYVCLIIEKMVTVDVFLKILTKLDSVSWGKEWYVRVIYMNRFFRTVRFKEE